MFKEYEESSFLQEKTIMRTNGIEHNNRCNKLKIPELTEDDMPVI